MSESDVINNNKRTLVAARKAPDTIKGKRDTSLRKIADLEKQLHAGIETENKKLKSSLKKAMGVLLKGMDEAVKAGEEFRAHRVNFEILKSVQDDIQEELSNTTLQLRDAKAGMASFGRAVKEATEQQQKAIAERNEKEEELREIINEMGGEEMFINTIYPQVIEHCPEGTVDEITARIGRLQALINQSIDNPDLRERHAVSKAHLIRLTIEVEEAQAAENNVQGHFDARKEVWLRAVQTIQEKISRLFHQYMGELNYEGQVELVREGTIMDYKMQIQVSFREKSLVSNLDASKHSGGERAVSTVMYLMALQELTSAPFRVVDEINQG
jgi:chromosome segregation ATPase